MSTVQACRSVSKRPNTQLVQCQHRVAPLVLLSGAATRTRVLVLPAVPGPGSRRACEAPEVGQLRRDIASHLDECEAAIHDARMSLTQYIASDLCYGELVQEGLLAQAAFGRLAEVRDEPLGSMEDHWNHLESFTCRAIFV